MTHEEVFKTALELSESDRILLATDLLETVTQDLPGWSIDDPGLPEELDSRANDGSLGVSWESVKSQLRADLEG